MSEESEDLGLIKIIHMNLKMMIWNVEKCDNPSMTGKIYPSLSWMGGHFFQNVGAGGGHGFAR